MNWRNHQRRFGSINDFATFELRSAEPTEVNLMRIAEETWAELTSLGYEPIDPCAVDGLHMAVLEIDDCQITVGLSEEEGSTWSLHVQMLDPGLFVSTRDRRLALLDRLNRDLHQALARPELKSIEWFQERKVVPKHGTARPMS